MIPDMSEAILAAFSPLIGLPCWNVERGQGSILSFEFGAPRLLVREPYASTSRSAKVRQRAAERIVKPVGEWNLFVFCCHWKISVSDETLANDDSSHKRIEAGARAIGGQKLTAVTLDAVMRKTIFAFDLGATLATWPYDTDCEEQWSLYLPDSRVLTYRADGRYHLGVGSENPDQLVWTDAAESERVP